MMQKFASLAQPSRCLFNSLAMGYHATQKPFINIPRDKLIDPKHIAQVLETNIPKKSKRSQRSLFHGKETKTGNQYSESDNATRRTWKPNVFEKTFYSEILKKQMQIKVSTAAIKSIRKYGGFDNYVLLTKPSNMDSLYGEYLRTLMMTKLKEPEFKVPYIVKSKPFNGKVVGWKNRFARRPTLFHPKDQRYTDLTKNRIKTPLEMTKKELATFNELERLSASYQDIQTNHPMIMEVEREEARQMALLEDDRQKVLAQFDRKPSRRQKERIMELFEDEETKKKKK